VRKKRACAGDDACSQRFAVAPDTYIHSPRHVADGVEIAVDVGFAVGVRLPRIDWMAPQDGAPEAGEVSRVVFAERFLCREV
jgi:hypothetical protein